MLQAEDEQRPQLAAVLGVQGLFDAVGKCISQNYRCSMAKGEFIATP
jgi:hypothetical protein